jgi:hypothetical protein
VTTSPDDAAKARAPARRSAASSATSPATSGDSCNRPTPSRRSYPHQFLDIEATDAIAGLRWTPRSSWTSTKSLTRQPASRPPPVRLRSSALRPPARSQVVRSRRPSKVV